MILVVMSLAFLQCHAHAAENHFAWLPRGVTLEIINQDPFICLLHHLVNEREIHEIKKHAFDRLERSLVGNYQVSNQRTSYTASFLRGEFAEVESIEAKIAKIISRPVNFIERLQVVRYTKGQEFQPHHDYYDAELKRLMNSQRAMTFLIYLNDVDPRQGGETVFPQLNLRVQPKKGSALFWYNLLENGTEDVRTLHGGSPLKSGEKWAVNVWIHTKEYTR